MSFYEDYSSLLQTVQDAWNGQFNIDHFRKILRNYQSALVNLAEKRPNDTDRQAVQSKQVKIPDCPPIVLTDQQVELVCRFSQSVGLSEIECVKLFYVASEKHKRDPGAFRASSGGVKSAVQAVVYHSYFSRRHNLLVALLDLVSMWVNDQEFPEALSLLVTEFMDEFFKGNFVLNIMNLLKDLHQRKEAEVKRQHQIEAYHAAQILFTVFRRKEISATEALALIDLIKSCSAELEASGPDAALRYQCYVYCATLMQAVDIKAALIAESRQQQRISASSAHGSFKHHRDGEDEFVREITKKGTEGWSNEHFRCVFLLLWSLFLKRVKASFVGVDLNIDDGMVSRMCLEAIDSRVSIFTGIEKNLLESPRFLSEPLDRQTALCEALGDFVNACLYYHNKEFETLMRQEEKVMWEMQASRQEAGAGAVVGNFSALLSVIALLCRHAPYIVPQLWDNANFTRLLLTDLNEGGRGLGGLGGVQASHAFGFGFPPSHPAVASISSSASASSSASGPSVSLDSPLLPAYATLLEALCQDRQGQGARSVYLLLDKSQRLSWEIIFFEFHRLLAKYLPRLHAVDEAATSTAAPPAYNRYGQRLATPAPASSARLPPAISQAELSMVKCMLRLVGCVVRNQAIKAILLQKAEYRVLDVLFGLLACRFPPSLKAQVLNCLAAFASDLPELATQIWIRIEKSQIIPTFHPAAARLAQQHPSAFQAPQLASRDEVKANVNVKTSGPLPLQGLYHDLEEVEKAQRTYPLTIAFVQLVLTLLYTAPIPSALGEEYRTPGIGPYVDFLRKAVFLQLDSRQYASPNQRFVLAEGCLAVFHKLISEMDPESALPDCASPGFELLCDLFSGQTLFKQLVTLTAHCFTKLQSDATSSAAAASSSSSSFSSSASSSDASSLAHVEGCLLLALKMLHSAMDKQEAFVTRVRQSGAKARVHPLPELLVRCPSELIAIAKAVGYAQLHTQDDIQSLVRRKEARLKRQDRGAANESLNLSLNDANVLRLTYESSDPSTSLLGLSQSLQQQQQLHAAQTQDEEDEAANEDSSEIAFYAASLLLSLSRSKSGLMLDIFEQHHASGAICAALAAQLAIAPPVSSVVADGVDGAVGEEKTSLALTTQKSPEVADRARIAILELLLTNLAVPERNLSHLLLGFDVRGGVVEDDLSRSPRRQCLDVLISLVRKPRFALQYPALAEACYQLLYKLCRHPLTSRPFLAYLQHFDMFFFLSLLDELPNHLPSFSSSPSTSSSSSSSAHTVSLLLQRGALLRCLALELHVACVRPERFHDNDYVEHALGKLGFIQSPLAQTSARYNGLEQRGARVLELLDALRISLDAGGEPEDMPASVNHVPIAHFRTTTTSSSSSASAASSTASAYVFSYDIKTLYAHAAACMDAAQAARLCSVALQWNALNSLLAALQDAFVGWKQLVELCLYEAFDPEPDPERYESVVLELLTGLLQRLASEERVWMVLGDGLSSVALTLMAKLREAGSGGAGPGAGGAGAVADGVGGSGGVSSHVLHTPVLLQLLLKALPQHRHHLTRAHLYGVFINYMQYCRELQGPAEAKGSLSGLSDLDLLHSELLQRCPALLPLLSQDARDGPPRLRSMALVALTHVLGSGSDRSIASGASVAASGAGSSYWIEALSKRGIMAQFASQLRARDAVLAEAIVDPQLKHYEHILNHESLMAFLLKLAESSAGVDLLLDFDVVPILTQCRCLKPVSSFFSIGSGVGVGSGANAQLPTPTQRHQQVLAPVLRLLVAMLTAKPQHVPLQKQVLAFVQGHEEMVMAIVKDQPPHLAHVSAAASVSASASLRLLDLTLALFYFLNQGPLAGDKNISRYDSLLLSLLSRYADPTYSRDPRFRSLRPLSGGLSASSSLLTSSSDTGLVTMDEDSLESESERLECEELINSISQTLLAICVAKTQLAQRRASSSASASASTASSPSPATSSYRSIMSPSYDALASSSSSSFSASSSSAASEALLFSPQLEGAPGVECSMWALLRVLERTLHRVSASIKDQTAVQHILDQISTISRSELADFTSTRGFKLQLPDHLNDSTKRALAATQLRAFGQRLGLEARSCLFSLETTLQLLYQHLSVYLSRDSLLHSSQSKKLHLEAQELLLPLLESLAALVDSSSATSNFNGSGSGAEASAGVLSLLPSSMSASSSSGSASTALILLPQARPEFVGPATGKDACSFVRTLLRKLRLLLQ